MKYYIDIERPDGKHIAGEMETDKELTQVQLVKEVSDFAEQEKICARWAVDHCHWEIR